MYLIGSLLLALGVSVFAVSKIAEMLHAKKPGMERILLASLIGSIAAFITLVALGAFVKNVDQLTMIILSVLAMFVVSTMAFKSINKMSWSGAVTTNIANIALVLITVTAAVVLNGESIDKTIKSVKNIFNANTAMVESLANGNTDPMSNVENINAEEINQNNEDEREQFVDEELEPTFKEVDLLPAATVKELEAKKNIVYKTPKYRVISLSNIRSAMDKTIRIKNTSGRVITGALKDVNSNSLIIEQRINGGLATTPISMTKIERLEVYR